MARNIGSMTRAYQGTNYTTRNPDYFSAFQAGPTGSGSTWDDTTGAWTAANAPYAPPTTTPTDPATTTPVTQPPATTPPVTPNPTTTPPPNPYADPNQTIVPPMTDQGGSWLMPDRPDLPGAPNPYDVAQQQIAVGQQTQGLNAVNQGGVFGNTQYVRDPVTGGIQAVNTGLNPAYQGVQNSLLTGLGTRPGDVSNSVYGQYTANLNPQWTASERDMRTRLANQGIPENSEAYRLAMDDFQRQKSAAYLQANQAAQTAGGQEQSRLLGGLLDLGGSATSGYQSTPAIATPSTGAYQYANFQANQDAYNQQMASYNTAMQGLFGLGASALGEGGIMDWIEGLF